MVNDGVGRDGGCNGTQVRSALSIEDPHTRVLELAMRHVVEGRLIVQRQRDTVARLAAAGRPTSEAEALLNVFLGNLAIFEEHERWLRDNSEEI